MSKIGNFLRNMHIGHVFIFILSLTLIEGIIAVNEKLTFFTKFLLIY